MRLFLFGDTRASGIRALAGDEQQYQIPGINIKAGGWEIFSSRDLNIK